MTHGAPSFSADVSCAQHLSHLGEAVDAWQGYAQGYAHGKMYISILFRRNRVGLMINCRYKCIRVFDAEKIDESHVYVICVRNVQRESTTTQKSPGEGAARVGITLELE